MELSASKYGFCRLWGPQEDAVISFLFVMGFGRQIICLGTLYWKNAFRNSRYSLLSWTKDREEYHFLFHLHPFFFSLSQKYIISKRQYLSGYMYSVLSSISSNKTLPFHQTKFRDLQRNPVFFYKRELTSVAGNIQLVHGTQKISARSRIISAQSRFSNWTYFMKT
jgi:hypothetical protein